ncbi:MAG: hypothetical protein ACF788_14000 [Novipirellula sp. JB048]
MKGESTPLTAGSGAQRFAAPHPRQTHTKPAASASRFMDPVLEVAPFSLPLGGLSIGYDRVIP